MSVVLTTSEKNRDSLTVENSRIGFHNIEGECLLRGTSLNFKCEYNSG